MKKILLTSTFVALFFFWACSSDDISEEIQTSIEAFSNNSDEFDRTSLTSAWIDSQLLPALEDLEASLTTLDATANTFTDDVVQINLDQLRLNYLEAYKIWQHVSIFFYEDAYDFDMNRFPVDQNQIDVNIVQGIDYVTPRKEFESQDDAQGFPALDYLINGYANTDEEILTAFSNTNEQEFLTYITNRMLILTQLKISTVESERASNIASVDNNKTSYFSKQYNDILQSLERHFREAKIVTPSGTRSRLLTDAQKNAGVTITAKPTFVESFFSPENSKVLYLEGLDAIQDIYYGRAYEDDADIIGVQHYITSLDAYVRTVDGEETSFDAYTTAVIENMVTISENLPDNFSEGVITNRIDFDNAFDAIQVYVTSIKGLQFSVFGLSIDFVDNDGD